MVQVDVFWGYGWGASLAVAAGRQLLAAKKPFESKYFVWTLLFLALCWAPTGMLLLIRHPSWETMQAADSFYSMNEWLILAFGITNVTQGILGFWVGLKLLQRGREYLAHLNWLLGYFGMFFILLYGWDGLGYDRFLYDRDLLPGSPAWTAGAGTAAGVLPALWRFLTSGVAFTLYTDGVYLLPPFFFLVLTWLAEGARESGKVLPSATRTVLLYLANVFIVGLGGAAITALIVRGVAYLLGRPDHLAVALGQVPAQTGAHIAAYLIGIPLALLALWFSVLRPGRPFHRLVRTLMLAGVEKGGNDSLSSHVPAWKA